MKKFYRFNPHNCTYVTYFDLSQSKHENKPLNNPYKYRAETFFPVYV